MSYVKEAQGIPSAKISIGSLTPADSPRLAGEDPQYIQQLAKIENPLPPILVSRSTGRVIDGMHRLGAARLRGDAFIAVRYFDGARRDEFVEAVRRNIRHGKPLTSTDRIAATARIIRTHPHWADRKIASLTGVASATVAALRRRSTDNSHHLNARVGRDGRIRPVNAAEGRERASKFLAAHPDASLRQVAAAASIALATAKDVRDRLRRGEDPLSEGQQRNRAKGRLGGPAPRVRGAPPPDIKPFFEQLGRDPALRFNEQGRNLLRLLSMQVDLTAHWDRVVAAVPAHCKETVAQAARQCADLWLQLAERIEEMDHGAQHTRKAL